MTPPQRKRKGSFEIGVNLRVTQCFDKGGRNYMEDYSKYYFEKDPTINQSVIFAFFGVFDGHGGTEAAELANQRLLDEIKCQDEFWSQNDNDVLQAIRQGFLNTHKRMVEERDKWPLTPSGFQSTAGTTASIAIIRNRKLYVGHVGDSAVVIGYCSSDSKDSSTDNWCGSALTVEHKPDHPEERRRIEAHGGSVRRKAGIHRVVWNRPKATNKCVTATASSTPVQTAAEYEEIPFLAVARSLGDLWSFDPDTGEFHVSPEPDICVYQLRPSEHRCLIIGSDGLWNVLKPETAVELVRLCERETESRVFADPTVPPTFFYHPAGTLVQYALERCHQRGVRADNVTALVVMIDPPGKPMTQLRLERRRLLFARLGLEERLGLDCSPALALSEAGGAGPTPLADVGNIRRLLVESHRAAGRDASCSPVGAPAPASQRTSTSEDTTPGPPPLPPVSEAAPPVLPSPIAPSGNSGSKLPALTVLRRTLQGASGFPGLVEAWSEACWRDMLAYCRQSGLAEPNSGELDAGRLLEHLMDMDAKYRKEALQAVPTVLSMRRAFARDHEMSVCLAQIPLLSREWTQLLVMSSSNPSSPTSPAPASAPTTPTSHPSVVSPGGGGSPFGPPSPPACRRWVERREKILGHLYQMLGRRLPTQLSREAQECMRAHVAREVSQRMRVSRPHPLPPVDTDADEPEKETEEAVPVKKEPVARTRRQRQATTAASNSPDASPPKAIPSTKLSPLSGASPPSPKKPLLRRVLRDTPPRPPSEDRLLLPTVQSPPAASNHVITPPDTATAYENPKGSPKAKQQQQQPSPQEQLGSAAAEDGQGSVIPWRSRRRRSLSLICPDDAARVDTLMEKLVVVVTPNPDDLRKGRLGGGAIANTKDSGDKDKATSPTEVVKPRPVLLPYSRPPAPKRQRKSETEVHRSKAAVVLPIDQSTYKPYFKRVIVDANAEARLEEVMRSVTYRTASVLEQQQRCQETTGRSRAATRTTSGGHHVEAAATADSSPTEAKRRRLSPEGSSPTSRRSLRLRSTKSD